MNAQGMRSFTFSLLITSVSFTCSKKDRIPAEIKFYAEDKEAPGVWASAVAKSSLLNSEVV